MHDILNTDEAAELLRVSRRTLLRWLRAGLVPGLKVGRDWRMSRAALLQRIATGANA